MIFFNLIFNTPSTPVPFYTLMNKEKKDIVLKSKLNPHRNQNHPNLLDLDNRWV